ncbi:MAG: hypothetical protein K0R17_1043 [Rariglobus sp.]|jgi:uncharacterized protein (TIGR03067 family)|nr:hypothetical protein [Rariglobus sp.]
MSTLHGTWHPIRAELDGEAAPALALERMELILQSDAYSVSFAGMVHDRGTFIQTASALVLTAHHGPNTGRVIPAIYQLAGDRLRICYGMDGTAPTAFQTSTGSRRYLVTYRRQPAQDVQ